MHMPRILKMCSKALLVSSDPTTTTHMIFIRNVLSYIVNKDCNVVSSLVYYGQVTGSWGNSRIQAQVISSWE